MKKLIIIFLFILPGSIFSQSLHHADRDLPCVNKEFHLFAHAVYDSLRTTTSEEQLQVAIDVANQMFSPICISFKLCKMDTVFNYNFNIIKPESELTELATQYGGFGRINLYLVTDTLVSATTAGICAGNVGSIENGNIYLKNIGALTHELGHFFGLLHTFEDIGEELVDGSNCDVAGDLICDTPADPYQPGDQVSEYIKDCIFYAEMKDANGEYYQPLVGNIMSYYNCDCGFTTEQYLKMAKNYLNASIKHW